MKILNVISTLDPVDGGVVDGAVRLAKIWRDWGHRVDFVVLDSPDAPYLEDQGDNIFALGKLGAPGRLPGPLSFKERFAYSPKHVPWLRQHAPDYDAVIVHMLWNYSALGSRRALVGSKARYFVFPHGSLDPWFKVAFPKKDAIKRMLWPISEGRLCNEAQSMLFTTEEERRQARNRYWPYRPRSAVVGFGAADATGDRHAQELAFRSAFPALGDRRFLLFLSRIHPKKGCDLLLRAFANIAARDPNLDLVMAGPDQKGWRAELEAIATDAGVASRVHWTGMIEGDLKWGAFHGCEAFVLPSHSENFGIVVAEALACSKPVLISDKVNLWREVADEQAGLVEPDTQVGADALLGRYLDMSPLERTAMQAAARACFERHFRMEAAAANILAVLDGTTKSTAEK